MSLSLPIQPNAPAGPPRREHSFGAKISRDPFWLPGLSPPERWVVRRAVQNAMLMRRRFRLVCGSHRVRDQLALIFRLTTSSPPDGNRLASTTVCRPSSLGQFYVNGQARGTFVLAYKEPRDETDWNVALMAFAANAVTEVLSG